MAVPKRKAPSSRTRSRRSAWRLKAPTLVVCENAQCGKLKPPHSACPHCGYYKGTQVFQPKQEKD